MNNRRLDERLRAANPVQPVFKAGETATMLQRLGKSLLVMLGLFVLGVGASWAATGKNPVASIMGGGIQVAESEVGLDSFSSLRPMTPGDLAVIPDGIAMIIRFRAETKAFAERLEARVESDDRPIARDGRFRPNPAFVSAIGFGTTNLGTRVTMMVVDDEVCAYVGGFSLSHCDYLDRIAQGEMIWSGVTWNHTKNEGHTQVVGLVTDEVVAVQLGGSTDPPISLSGNVWEFRDLPPGKYRIIGLDEDGEEVFRERVPVSSYGSP